MSVFNKAKWVWPKSTSNLPNQYCQFIQEWKINNIEKTNFYISATSDYELYINGKFVSCRQYHDYPNEKSYDTIDITDYLQKGNNRLAILGYNIGEETFSYIKDTAGIIFATDKYELVSGNDTYYRISQDYKCGNIEKLSPQLGWTFEFNATKSDNWKDFDYDYSKWSKITSLDIMNKTYNFFPRPIKKLESLAHTKPKIIVAGSFIRKIKEGSAAYVIYNDFLGASCLNEKIDLPNKDFQVKCEKAHRVYYIIDMGKEVAGNIYLNFTAKAGTILEVAYGEQLDDMRVRGYVGDRHFGFRYYAKEGLNEFIHRLTRFGGRYIQIHVTGEAFIKDAKIIPTDYNAPLKSFYDSANSLENKINEVCIRTLRICMHEHFEDTPWREQGLYGMDSRNQILCNYYTFADYDFIKSCLKTFTGTFKEDGFFEITSPCKFDFTIPSFTMAWIMMIKDYLMYSGDYDFVKEMIPQIKYTLNKVFHNIDNSGLVPTNYENRYWNYIEWSQGMDGARSIIGSAGDYSLAYNSFIALAIESFIIILDNFNENSSNYKEILNKLRQSADKLFWDKDKGFYNSFIGGLYPKHYSQLCGALAILAGFSNEEKSNIVREKIISDKDLVECTLSMTTYKYEALLGNKKYADFVFDEIEKLWGYMLYNGATTFWETIKGAWDFAKAGSLSHAWSATPIYFYNAYLLGVKPTKPGFEEYEINPVKKNYINAKIWTPKGYIEIHNK